MRYDRNFHPEWGYVAAAPSVMRTVRLIAVAAIIGATASAATVFSLLDRPVAEESVAARTLVTPAPGRPLTASTSSVAAQQPTEPQQVKSPAEAENSAQQKSSTGIRSRSGGPSATKRACHDLDAAASDQRSPTRQGSCSKGDAACSDVQRYSSRRARSRAGSEAAKQEIAHDVANRAAYRWFAL